MSDLLISSHHKFRKGCSTISALLSLVRMITNVFENRGSVMLSLYDLSKAFDVVSHDSRIAKIQMYKIAGAVLRSKYCGLFGGSEVVGLIKRSFFCREIDCSWGASRLCSGTAVINDLCLKGHTLLFANNTTLFTSGLVCLLVTVITATSKSRIYCN